MLSRYFSTALTLTSTQAILRQYPAGIDLLFSYFEFIYEQPSFVSAESFPCKLKAFSANSTDYADRNYSCGYDSNPNEEQSTVGAVYIPGAPKGGEPGSYMLACSDGTDRKFTANDIVALKTLYPVK